MRLKICIALVLVIVEGSYCLPSTFEETKSSSWGYEFNLNNSRGFSGTYDKKNGLSIEPLDNQNNTGFHKKYVEKTVHDQYSSIDGQKPTYKHTVDEYVEGSNPASADGDSHRTPNGDLPVYNKTDLTTPSPYGYTDPRPGPQSENTAAKTSPLGGGTIKPVDNSPKNQYHSKQGATDTFEHRVHVENRPDKTNVATYNTPYGYNVPPYQPLGAPGYNNPNPMYGVAGNQMYVSWQTPMTSAYGQFGSTHGTGFSAFSSAVPIYYPTGFAYRPPAYGEAGTFTGATGPVYGSTGSAYAQSSLASSSSWSSQSPQSGQMYGPGYGQTFMDRRPMYDQQQRNY
ncbi:hypothetical protein B5X24_HaOG212567 [Helicoverpa armigera]|uniref:Uncharacterized protein n=1 Tax=Helicoverpa armigera TaxID=29058 RepID=A0A2W1B6X1_HELAM|nr:hypothetical protein B5X24_HaOG212567 [Helicoverpa armigera]